MKSKINLKNEMKMNMKSPESLENGLVKIELDRNRLTK